MSCCRRNRNCCRRREYENSWRNSGYDYMNQGCNCYRNNQNYNNNSCNRCDNNQEASFPENYMLAHAYVPTQRMNKTFEPEVALRNGTLFPELVSPYYPGQSMEIIEYLRNDDRNGGCGCE